MELPPGLLLHPNRPPLRAIPHSIGRTQYSSPPAIGTGTLEFLPLGNLAVPLRRGDFNRVAAFGAPTKLLVLFLGGEGREECPPCFAVLFCDQIVFNDTACNGARGSTDRRHKALRI